MLENLEPALEIRIPFAIPIPGAIVIPIIIVAGGNIDIREFFVLPRIHEPDDFKKRSMTLVGMPSRPSVQTRGVSTPHACCTDFSDEQA